MHILAQRLPIVSSMATSTPNNPQRSAGLYRLIDASTNRASEGLRVLEDISRFVLDDASLSSRLKAARHDLQQAVDALGVERLSLLAARDTQGDVGRAIKTDAEASRPTLASIAGAAAGRTAQALRSLEESAKLLDTDTSAAAAFESLRYRLYDLHKTLELALGGSEPVSWQLCVLISESLCIHHNWREVAGQALAGGADCLQLREKDLSDRELLKRATTLAAMTHEANASLVINDRPDIALLCGAQGVHVGQSDLPIDAIRKMVRWQLLVGASATTITQAQQAVRAGADVCGLGPMFASTTKPDRPVAGLSLLRRYLDDPLCQALPHLAIGGITPDNLPELLNAGCRGIALSSAVCSSPHP